MTDEQIIKALELCAKPVSEANCPTCPFYKNKIGCSHVMMNEAIDLINRLKANEEKTENVIRLAEKTIEKQSKEIDKQQAEIEEWKTLAHEGKEKVELLEIEKSAMQHRIDKQQAEIKGELKVQTYDGKVENSSYYCAKGICQACHYNSERHDECMRRLIKDACEAGHTDEIIIEDQRKTIGEQKAEIERLKRDRYLVDEKGRFELLPRTDIEEIKSEAYKELAERLYTYRTGISIKGEEMMIIPMSDYEEILKELTGLKGSKSTGLDEEIRRLQKDKADIISAVEYRINQAKESAYKEFAEKLQDMLGDPFLREHYDVCIVIDNILAEVTPNFTKVDHSSLCETETYEGVTDTNVGGKKNDFKE